MTYHLENRFNKFNDEFVLIFPYKLYDAANASLDLIKWTKDGTSILVYTTYFEEKVLDLYPNLVEIPQFTNFRRQMRAYGFSWYQHKSDLFEFSHTYFKRGHDELLKFVLTRRKQIKLDSIKARDYYIESNDNVVNGSFKMKKTMKIRPRPCVNYATMQKRPYKTRNKSQENSYSGTCEETMIKNTENPEKKVACEIPKIVKKNNNVPFSKATVKERLFDLEVFHSCQSWMLQNDPYLARQFELDSLNASLRHVQQFINIPIHFYD